MATVTKIPSWESPALKLVDNTAVGAFRYERYSLKSVFIGKNMTCARVYPAALENLKKRTTIYIVHGLVGDDSLLLNLGFFENLPKDVVDLCIKENVELILPSCGAGILRHDTLESKESYADYFSKEIMPIAEADTSNPAERRLLVGYSAGGASALRMLLENPALFDGSALIFSALFYHDIYSETETANYLAQTGADPNLVTTGCQALRDLFYDRADYERFNPIPLLRNTDGSLLDGKKLFLDVGSADEIGFWHAARKTSELLKDKKIEHVFDERPGAAHDLESLKIGMANGLRFLLTV